MAKMTYDEAREALRGLTDTIRAREADYEEAIKRAADTEAVYRAALAEAFRHHRTQGAGAGEAETLARADVATLSRERDAAAGMVKLAAERLEDRRDDRRSFNRLVEWSAAHDLPGRNGTPENVPDGSYGGAR
jgi:hypothetical protein